MINRNLLIGIGLGLVFSAGFLSVFPVAAPGLTMTKEQLDAYAKAQNLVLVPKEQYDELKNPDKRAEQDQKKVTPPTKPTDTTAPKPATPPTGTNPGAVTQPGETAPPTETKAPASTAPATPAPPIGTVVPSAPKEAVTIIIPYKATGKNVATLLVDAGLLPANNQFIATLKEQNKLNRIRVGTYKIPKGTSTDEIIRMITTPPAQ